MKNLFPSHITIEGRPVSVEIFIRKQLHQDTWLKDIALFLEEWYSPDDHILVKTSGSTGMPKVIKLQKEFIAESARRTLQYFNLKAADKVLLCLPLQYIAGKLMVVRALIGSLDLYPVDPATGFSFLQHQTFKFAAMVPNQVSKILENEPNKGAWLSNIRQLLIGGSAIPWQVEQKLQEVSTQCYSSYGMTETATHIALRRLNGASADDYYHCLENIHVVLAADDCLQIYMPGLNESFLQTRDIAELRDEKTFRILGRADHVIISGGIKFFPEQIEKKLEPYLNLPFMMTSEPHDSLGQQLVLVIEGMQGKKLEAQLKEICSTVLQRYEQPRRINFINRIPLTKSGKADRSKL